VGRTIFFLSDAGILKQLASNIILTSPSAWFTPDQECVTSILLNVRYAVIGWNLVSHSYGVDRSSTRGHNLRRLGLKTLSSAGCATD